MRTADGQDASMATNAPRHRLVKSCAWNQLSRVLAFVEPPRQKRKGYFLRAETAFGFMEVVSGMRGYWDEDTAQMSHGEGFLTVFSAMFREPGLYLMDEPEAALSFTSCLQLVAPIQKLGQSGAQVVCATHSPLLAATPGADIVEIGEEGLRRTTWDKLELVDHWRRYLHDPNSYLRHVTDS